MTAAGWRRRPAFGRDDKAMRLWFSGRRQDNRHPMHVENDACAGVENLRHPARHTFNKHPWLLQRAGFFRYMQKVTAQRRLATLQYSACSCQLLSSTAFLQVNAHLLSLLVPTALIVGLPLFALAGRKLGRFLQVVGSLIPPHLRVEQR